MGSLPQWRRDGFGHSPAAFSIVFQVLKRAGNHDFDMCAVASPRDECARNGGADIYADRMTGE
jgi:hypothetical protein